MTLLKRRLVFVISFELSGCLYGQCMEGMCALERAAYLKSIKAYGEYWTKPGMTKGSWRADWVACGGMSNGQYSGDAPTGAITKMILESQERERKKLTLCMQGKGYEYRYTGP
jgi:hypothetical protein